MPHRGRKKRTLLDPAVNTSRYCREISGVRYDKRYFQKLSRVSVANFDPTIKGIWFLKIRTTKEMLSTRGATLWHMRSEDSAQKETADWTDLKKILMRFLTVPLTLASGPPGLPVLDSVLLPSGHPEDVLSPVRLQRGGGWQGSNELDVGKASVQLLDGVVGDTVGSRESFRIRVVFGTERNICGN